MVLIWSSIIWIVLFFYWNFFPISWFMIEFVHEDYTIMLMQVQLISHKSWMMQFFEDWFVSSHLVLSYLSVGTRNTIFKWWLTINYVEHFFSWKYFYPPGQSLQYLNFDFLFSWPFHSFIVIFAVYFELSLASFFFFFGPLNSHSNIFLFQNLASFDTLGSKLVGQLYAIKFWL